MNKEKMILKYYKYKYEDYGWNPIFCMVMRIKHKALKRNPNVTSFEEMIKWSCIENYYDFFSCVNINQHDNLVGLKYNLQTTPKDMWDNPNSPYRECRSIVIDIKNEKIVMCPFRKFFNLDEVEENKLDKVRIDILKSTHFEITNKLDGSMQCATYYNGEILLTGSTSINYENSWRIQDGYSMLDDSYKLLISNYPNYTFIFEYISKKDAHVVNYSKEQEGLYLIGIRHNIIGIELSYLEVITLAHKYNVKVVEMEHLTLNELLKEMKIAKCDKKEVMIHIQTMVDKDIRKYVISKYLGQEYNILKSKNGKYSKASEIGIEEEI